MWKMLIILKIAYMFSAMTFTYYAALFLNSQWTCKEVGKTSFHLVIKERATTGNNLKTKINKKIRPTNFSMHISDRVGFNLMLLSNTMLYFFPITLQFIYAGGHPSATQNMCSWQYSLSGLSWYCGSNCNLSPSQAAVEHYKQGQIMV